VTTVAQKPHIIVFANEKGGTGKSTTAVHVAIALRARGARVSAMDLDHRQRTMGRYFDNRAVTEQRTGKDLFIPRHATHDGDSLARFSETFEALAEGTDFLVIDTTVNSLYCPVQVGDVRPLKKHDHSALRYPWRWSHEFRCAYEAREWQAHRFANRCARGG
jgi:hypothetical protein